MGGEKFCLVVSLLGFWGSPPRGRGKGFDAVEAAGFIGITPAWAGKRNSAKQWRRTSRDHPRVGGEKFIFDRNNEASIRITPAWAGKRIIPIRNTKQAGDHPRVGGEKILTLTRSGRMIGSPPRGRGKGKKFSTCSKLLGITPAWAGKSCPAQQERTDGRDHPRVGGEKLLI